MAVIAEPEKISTGQTARILGVSPVWVRKLAEDGVLSSQVTTLGRLFNKTEVERLAEQRAQKQGR